MNVGFIIKYKCSRCITAKHSSQYVLKMSFVIYVSGRDLDVALTLFAVLVGEWIKHLRCSRNG